MNSVAYRNFDLQIRRTSDGYFAQVQSADAGEASHDFRLPFSEDKLEALMSKFGPPRRVRNVGAPDQEAAKTFGGELYKAVFASAVGNLLSRSIETAAQKGERLRIRLRLTGVPELASLPWEYLYDAENDRFLVLSYKTSIVRYLEIPQPINPLAIRPPLRVLALASSPLGYDALGVDKEWSNLQAALSRLPHGLVETERLESARLSALQERLRQGDQFHIFHYIGHGGFDPRTGRSVLVMEDENRQADFIDGQRLGVLLHNHNSLRLTILNACEGAVANSQDVFSGVAQNLIRQEIPAVVAMQFEITDRAAVTLAKAFYEALARGNQVDTALGVARLAIFAAAESVEWGTPVLYLRASDGQIFEMQPSAQGEATELASTERPALEERPTPNFPSLEPPEGTMPPQSPFYVQRESDAIALGEIQRQGVTITILGPRQVGKSSLLIRAIDAADKAGKRVALLDFQLIDKTLLSQADTFFLQFCYWLTSELGLEDQVAEFFEKNKYLGNIQRCTRYVELQILRKLDQPLVLAMDEVDIVFNTNFRSDFFGMLRGWHNSRAINRYWKQLDLALITSTEPHCFIENLTQSPFNVGETIELKDFTPAQVADLNRRHGTPFNGDEERRLIALLGGHPYLVRLALYKVAGQRIAVDELFANATADDGAFGKHLHALLGRLQENRDLVQGLRQIINRGARPDERILYRLQAAGFVRREGNAFVPRCQLYADYFKEHLHG